MRAQRCIRRRFNRSRVTLSQTQPISQVSSLPRNLSDTPPGQLFFLAFDRSVFYALPAPLRRGKSRAPHIRHTYILTSHHMLFCSRQNRDNAMGFLCVVDFSSIASTAILASLEWRLIMNQPNEIRLLCAHHAQLCQIPTRHLKQHRPR